MKVLVIASDPIPLIVCALRLVTAPMTRRSWWLRRRFTAPRCASGSPTLTRRSAGQSWVQRETVEGLDDAGLDARGDTGEGDPVKAVADVLVTFSAERILIFTRSSSEEPYDGVSTPRHCSTTLACRSSRSIDMRSARASSWTGDPSRSPRLSAGATC